MVIIMPYFMFFNHQIFLAILNIPHSNENTKIDNTRTHGIKVNTRRINRPWCFVATGYEIKKRILKIHFYLLCTILL